MGRKGLSGRVTAGIAAASLAAVVISGCGSGSSSSSSSPGQGGHPADTAEPSTGVGMRAPISKVVVAQRSRPWKGRPRGSEAVGSKGCVKEEGRGEIGVYTDTPEPTCVQVTGRQGVLIVNRTGAYHRSEGKPIEVGLGPYRARLLPQQAAHFGPVGRFLGRGLHTAFDDRGRLGVLIEPADCGIFQASPGEPLCFRRERASRLRRWHVAVVRENAPPCRGSDLVISVDRRTEDAAGTIYSKLDVANRSRSPCNVAGVPRVTALDTAGKVVATARAIPLLRPRSRPDHRRTWLRGGGGGGVSFTVTHADGSTFGRCGLAWTSGLRVTMPDTAHTQFVPLPMGYCPPPRGALALRVGRTE
jgi:Protein of unknown function (DUF4232)